MYDAQDKPVEVAIDAAIADFIAAIEALAHHAPIRSVIYASAISKLIDRVAETTPDNQLLAEYVEDAATNLRDDLADDGATSKRVGVTRGSV